MRDLGSSLSLLSDHGTRVLFFICEINEVSAFKRGCTSELPAEFKIDAVLDPTCGMDEKDSEVGPENRVAVQERAFGNE